MYSFEQKVANTLAIRREKHNYRTLTLLHEEYCAVDFASNNYLGLAQDKELLEEAYRQCRHAKDSSVGSTGSRLLTGNSCAIEKLEKELAQFFEAEAALFFPTGYMAMLALLSSLPDRRDIIYYDHHIHACAKDGMRLSFAQCVSFPHNSLDILEKKLAQCRAQQAFVVTEALYSMRGDQVALQDLMKICRKYSAVLILDEAHSTGVIGAQGKGLAYDTQTEVPLRMHTFGKAWGAQGAVILCTESIRKYLINVARPFVYSTAPMPLQIELIAAILRRAKADRLPIDVLCRRIAFFKEVVRRLRLPHCTPQQGPVQAFHVSQNQCCRATSKHLLRQGYDVRAILSPTVPEGEEQLRICLHTFNTKDEILGLIQAIQSYSLCDTL